MSGKPGLRHNSGTPHSTRHSVVRHDVLTETSKAHAECCFRCNSWNLSPKPTCEPLTWCTCSSPWTCCREGCRPAPARWPEVWRRPPSPWLTSAAVRRREREQDNIDCETQLDAEGAWVLYSYLVSAEWDLCQPRSNFCYFSSKSPTIWSCCCWGWEPSSVEKHRDTSYVTPLRRTSLTKKRALLFHNSQTSGMFFSIMHKTSFIAL